MRLQLTVLLLIACLWSTACGPAGPYVWASQLAQRSGAAPIMRAGDRLQVVVHGQDAMSGEFEIRPGGEVVLPVAGSVRAAGFTTLQLTAEITRRLQGVLARPVVTVVIAVRKAATVSVLGEVRTPGRYELRDGEGLLEALARAGGLTPFADPDALFVVRRNQPGPRVRFRFADLAAGVPSSINYELVDGDVVVAE